MYRYNVALISFLVAGSAAVSWAQSNLTLVADADTCVQLSSPTTGSATARLQVRSYSDGVSVVRQNIAYIRFDLNVLASTPEAGAAFSISRNPAKLSIFNEGEVHVYGLLDTAGNTPQQWDEGLTYSSTGLELPNAPGGGITEMDIDLTRLQYIGDLPGSPFPADGEIFSISNNVALDTFIADRYAADGYMTLMIVQEYGVNRELYFYNRETTTTNLVPSLFVVGELGGIVEDTTPPTVVLTSPTNNAGDVDVAGDVTALFSEPMDETSISTNTILLYDALSNSIPASVSYNSGTLTATLNPAEWLDENSTFTAVVLGRVTDASTNAMGTNYTWSFTTGDAPYIDPNAPIVLTPDADAYLTNDEKNGPTDTHGTKTLVEVRWHPVRIHIGYVRFDITGISPTVFESATLQGTFSSTSFDGPGEWNVWGLDDSAAGNNWDEGSINYATAAGLDPTAPINSFGITNATLLGTISLDGAATTNPPTFTSSTTNLNLASFLEADTDGLVTFIIMSTTNSGTEFRVYSKETTSPMTLNFEPASEPPTPPEFTNIAAASGSSVILYWTPVSSYTYGIERSESMKPANWITIASNLVDTTYTDDALPGDKAFYRVFIDNP